MIELKTMISKRKLIKSKEAPLERGGISSSGKVFIWFRAMLKSKKKKELFCSLILGVSFTKCLSTFGSN